MYVMALWLTVSLWQRRMTLSLNHRSSEHQCASVALQHLLMTSHSVAQFRKSPSAINPTSAMVDRGNTVPGVVDHFESQNGQLELVLWGAQVIYHHLLLLWLVMLHWRQSHHLPALTYHLPHPHTGTLASHQSSKPCQVFNVMQHLLLCQWTKVTELAVCRMMSFCTSSTRYVHCTRDVTDNSRL